MSVFEEHSRAIAGGAVSLVVGAILWLTRTVFTNNKRLSLLEERIDLQRQITDAQLSAIEARAERSEKTLAMIADDHRKTGQVMSELLQELRRRD